MSDSRTTLVSYLAATGWAPSPEAGSHGSLWYRSNSPLAVPVPRELDDEDPEWELIIDRLARVEGRDASAVELRVRTRLVDVANLRAAKDLIIEDTIPFSTASSMVRNSWAMLRSCATTSMGARAHIGGNYRRTGDEILSHARMAHTQRGSYIIPIYMPVAPTDQPVRPREGQIEDLATAPPESPQRRVMRTFAEALTSVDAVLQRGEEPSADSIRELIRAGVSHEFTARLHRILTDQSVADFSTSFEWAPGGAPEPATPSHVGIPAEAAELVERFSRRLKTERPKRDRETLTGPIIGVRRDDDSAGGVATIQTVRSARLCHVSVNVSPERLDDALDWMKQRATAVVSGRVRRVGAELFSDRRDGIGLLAHEQLPS